MLGIILSCAFVIVLPGVNGRGSLALMFPLLDVPPAVVVKAAFGLEGGSTALQRTLDPGGTLFFAVLGVAAVTLQRGFVLIGAITDFTASHMFNMM